MSEPFLFGLTKIGFVASLFFSVVGFKYFKSGRQVGDAPKWVSGILLLCYQMVSPSTIYLVCGGIILSVVPNVVNKIIKKRKVQ